MEEVRQMRLRKQELEDSDDDLEVDEDQPIDQDTLDELEDNNHILEGLEERYGEYTTRKNNTIVQRTKKVDVFDKNSLLDDRPVILEKMKSRLNLDFFSIASSIKRRVSFYGIYSTHDNVDMAT